MLQSKENGSVREIITTDPGVDDAMAILVGLVALKRPAFVATYGNATTDRTYTNLKKLLKFASDSRIREADSLPLAYAGASQPSTGAPFILETKYGGSGAVEFIHGKNGLQGLTSQSIDIKDGEKSGVLYQREVRDENTKIDLFSFGALTEIDTILKNPKMAKKVATITVMGGAFEEAGNTNTHQEANFRHDPPALVRIIQKANELNIPVTIVPLDLTHEKELEFTEKRFQQMINRLGRKQAFNIAGLIISLLGQDSVYSQFYRYNVRDRRNRDAKKTPRIFEGPPLHDLTALMVRLHPGLFNIAKHIKVKVTLDGSQAGEIGYAQDHMEPHGFVNIATSLKGDPTTSANSYWKMVADYLGDNYH